MQLTRRSVLSGLLVGSAGLALSACGGDTADPKDLTGVLDRVKKTGELRIGMEGVFSPYGYHEGDKLVGIEKELGDLVAAGLGVKPKYIETKWDSLIAGIDVNKYDVIFNNIAATEERKQKYDFSVPYLREMGRVAVHKDSPIQTLADLTGKKAAQTPTSNYGKTAVKLGGELVTVDGFVQAIDLVASGRADFTIYGLISFQQYQKEHPDAPIRVLDIQVPQVSDACALINKGNEDFRAELDRILTALIQDGSIKKITEKYTGHDLSPR